MAAVTVRDLADDTVRRLRVHAAENGNSMEAELRHLLIAFSEQRVEVLPAPRQSADERREADMEARIERVQAKVRRMFGGELPKGRVDAFLAERRQAAEKGE